MFVKKLVLIFWYEKCHKNCLKTVQIRLANNNLHGWTKRHALALGSVANGTAGTPMAPGSTAPGALKRRLVETNRRAKVGGLKLEWKNDFSQVYHRKIEKMMANESFYWKWWFKMMASSKPEMKLVWSLKLELFLEQNQKQTDIITEWWRTLWLLGFDLSHWTKMRRWRTLIFTAGTKVMAACLFEASEPLPMTDQTWNHGEIPSKHQLPTLPVPRLVNIVIFRPLPGTSQPCIGPRQVGNAPWPPLQ